MNGRPFAIYRDRFENIKPLLKIFRHGGEAEDLFIDRHLGALVSVEGRLDFIEIDLNKYRHSLEIYRHVFENYSPGLGIYRCPSRGYRLASGGEGISKPNVWIPKRGV